ncbi:unnamed protein product [Ranitomeya imitator]|uniref:Uncharacterized protein n=1 Tax=Ranitomeya imitator TaxID=111125 RepID=A0ABN9MD56_9NEOB|nr:unnamed protein product [Ranitomeya imitator]
MKVKDGSKIRNLMGFAIGRMESEDVRQILFSGIKDPLDTTESGYQAPGDYDSMWIQELKVESKGPKRRKPGAGRGVAIGRKQPRPPGGRGETPKKLSRVFSEWIESRIN